MLAWRGDSTIGDPNSRKPTLKFGSTAPEPKSENKWPHLRWPLHVIQFGACLASEPPDTGGFQYSHHVLAPDQAPVHASQFLLTVRGLNPNFVFLRALLAVLRGDAGSVLCWSDGERKVLEHLRIQLRRAAIAVVPDRSELLHFIDALVGTGEGDARIEGSRALVEWKPVCERHALLQPHEMPREGAPLCRALRRLQAVDLHDAERQAIKTAMLRYAQLNTSCMARAVQTLLAARRAGSRTP